MQIEIERMPKMSFEDFADQHNLTLRIKELSDGLFRASFYGCYEARQDSVRVFASGEPMHSVAGAINDLARAISGTSIIVRDVRVSVPRLSVKGTYDEDSGVAVQGKRK